MGCDICPGAVCPQQLRAAGSLRFCVASFGKVSEREGTARGREKDGTSLVRKHMLSLYLLTQHFGAFSWVLQTRGNENALPSFTRTGQTAKSLELKGFKLQRQIECTANASCGAS